ncbi:hypothetical protein C2S52_015930 [Perilla frutescens var. hirtella]|nr:hypothetical protein C2S52_015930 [Perilla frutescens var. hirtella]
MTEYFIPHCELKPTVEQSFKTLDEGVKFYRIYAESSGFDIRLGSEKKSKNGTTIWKYVYCSREGEKNAVVKVGDSSDVVKTKKRRVSKRSNCRARIVFRFCCEKGYIVKLFEERHSHPLVSDDFKRFMKVNRNLDDVHKNFVLNCARANIGAMRSYRLFKEGVGSYSDVGCTGVDFKNYARDLRAYIHGADAQIVLDKFHLRKQSHAGFFFEYCVGKEDRLTHIFWADALSRRNYAAFGDVVSFDSTYSLNRYNMIFAPFTGKDSHGKCVYFGVSLLSGEDNESYSWVFEKFLKCMGNSPGMIITDQDPALKIAVEQSFPDSRHRLCMWHIMMKVPEKAPRMLRKDESFMKRLSDAVWSDYNEPSDFDLKWNNIMVDYCLTNDSWFNFIFIIREYWIPAYFRKLPMSGLCRTTSISESSNSLFNHYINFRSNLVEFFMHFDSAIDAQRHAYDLQESLDESTVPITKTPLEIEKHASSIYTSEMFKKVQEEIVASCFKCSVAGINHCDFGLLYDVDDGSKITHRVTYNKEEDTVECSCKKFIRDGILCSHVFLLLKHLKIVSIPSKYIASRWTRTALVKHIHGGGAEVFGKSVVSDNNRSLLNQLFSEFYSCLGYVERDVEKMNSFLAGLQKLKALFQCGDMEGSTSHRKTVMFEQFYGLHAPSEVVVHPPIPVKTKGSGSRLISKKEARKRKENKAPRMCSNCHNLSDHDARNCPF